MPDPAGVTYTRVEQDYFDKRGLRRYAGVWSLWALGVGAVISGQFSGWNIGLANGWGSMLLATFVITAMYLGLTYSIAEMSPALPHTGGAYSFARTAMGPWGGFLTGLAENVEYVLTPAVIVYFISTYMSAIFGTAPGLLPLWWIAFYAIFVWLNIVGVELSFRVTVVVTVLALLCLVVFFLSAIGHVDFARWAMNVGPGGEVLPDGNGPFLPLGLTGILACLPFAVWLYLAIEQLPLAAEESVDPQRDMPKGILAGMFTLIVLRVPDPLAEPGGRGRGLGGARQVRRAAARRLPRDLRREHREAARARGGRRADRELPHDHLRERPADLLAEPRRLLPVRPLGDARQPQDAARRDDPRERRRARGDARALVHARLGSRRGGDRRDAPQHGRVRRDDLVRDAGDSRSSCCGATSRTSRARTRARSACRARSPPC